ncbi:MAG: O-antigen ligase family protein [Patescibacteria group bacterium]|nr:O-antigen ligase family protein [Patescibacteria group bacterium]
MKNFNKEMTPKKLEYLLLTFFLILRLASFWTYQNLVWNSSLATILIISFTYLTLKNLPLAWTILVTELFLDGAGGFFQLGGLILRTWFLGIFALAWLGSKIKNRKLNLSLPKPILITLLLSIFTILLAIILGLKNGHGTILVLQDAILYFFVFLLFPTLEFTNFPKKYFISLSKIFIILSGVFSLLTFFIYSSALGFLQNPYYHWFRDIAGGKITDLGNHFFRVVLSNQIIIVPLVLIFISYLIKQSTNKKWWFLTSLSLLILIMNFSRIYFLALAFGMLILAYKNNFKKWFLTSLTITTLFITIFISLNLVSSRFNSIGLELIGLKISSIQKPSDDISGAIRLAMLPDIKEKISTHPYFGSGLATQVSYEDPATKEIVTRTQFDWGYFEMLAELGFVGTFIFLLFIIMVLYYLAKLVYKQKSPLHLGLFAGAISLFVINITTPALFQGFGILYFVFIMKIISENHQDDVSLQ